MDDFDFDFDFDWDMPGDLYDISSLGDIDWGTVLSDLDLSGFDLGTADQIYAGTDFGTGLNFYPGEGYGVGTPGGMAGVEALLGDLEDVYGDGAGAGTVVITGERPTDLSGFDIATADDVYKGTDTRTGFDFGTSDEVYQGSNLGTDPYEIDGQQGSRDESTALIGTTTQDPFEVDQQTSRDETDALKPLVIVPDKDPYEVDEPTSRDETDALTTSTNIIKEIIKTITNAVGGKDNAALIAALLGGLAGLRGNQPRPVGYQGGIPKYTATRGAARSPTEGGRRPGGAGIGSLTGGVSYTKAAGGGLMGLASGGRPARYLRGGTDGMADKIQTSIDGKQPARLSHGEFVIPADVVSHLGNGNSDAGADVLYDMMSKVRKARTGTAKQGKQINPRKYTPA